MDKKTKKGYYKKGEFQYPSVTKIIGDATDKSAPLMGWATGQVVEWIRQNRLPYKDSSYEDGWLDGLYLLTPEDLDKARFAYKDVSQEALDIGSEVHNAIERHLNWLLTGGMVELQATAKHAELVGNLSGQAANAFGAFLQWKDEHDLKPKKLEQTVYGNGWGGTLDFVGYYDDKLYVIDWKSSKAHYPEMRYQVAAYRNAREKELAFIAGNKVGKMPRFDDFPLIKGCGVLRLDKETGLPDFKDHSKTYDQDLKIFNAMVNLFFERHPKIRKGAGR